MKRLFTEMWGRIRKCVTVLQRNKTNRLLPSLFLSSFFLPFFLSFLPSATHLPFFFPPPSNSLPSFFSFFISFLEAVYVITEADKSKICRANVSVSDQGPASYYRAKRSWWLSLNAVRQQDSVLLGGRVRLAFYPGPQWIGSGPPTLGRTTRFTWSTNVTINLIQNFFTDTLGIMSDKISGHPMAHENGHIKSTIAGTNKR